MAAAASRVTWPSARRAGPAQEPISGDESRCDDSSQESRASGRESSLLDATDVAGGEWKPLGIPLSRLAPGVLYLNYRQVDKTGVCRQDSALYSPNAETDFSGKLPGPEIGEFDIDRAARRRQSDQRRLVGIAARQQETRQYPRKPHQLANGVELV